MHRRRILGSYLSLGTHFVSNKLNLGKTRPISTEAIFLSTKRCSQKAGKQNVLSRNACITCRHANLWKTYIIALHANFLFPVFWNHENSISNQLQYLFNVDVDHPGFTKGPQLAPTHTPFKSDSPSLLKPHLSGSPCLSRQKKWKSWANWWLNQSISSWWLEPTHLKSMLAKLEIFPN